MMFSDVMRRQLMEHLEIVLQTVDLLGDLFHAVADGADHREMHNLAEKIYEEERRADAVKIELRKQLPHTFFRSVERSDLLALVKAHDDIADACKSVATFLDVYEAAFEPSATQAVIALYEKVRAAVHRHATFIEDFARPREGKSYDLETEFLVYWSETDRVEESIEHLSREALRHILKRETVTRSALLLLRVVEHTTRVMSKTKNAVDCLDRMLRAQ